MNVRSEPLTAPRRSRLTVYRVVAIGLWLAGVWTTYLLIERMVAGQVWYASAIEASIIQAFLTVLESPVWKGRGGPVNIVAVAFDTLANAGGIYPFCQRIGETPPAQMFVQAFHLNGTIAPIVAVIIAGILGYMIAAGPEAIWRWE